MNRLPEQVVIPAAMVGFAYLAVSVAVIVIFGAAAIAAWRRDRRDEQHDVGPDALQLLDDLDAHLDQFAIDDPEVKAGLSRLLEALGTPPAGDEQQSGGESA